MILNVTDRSGNTHQLEALEGWRVMEVIRDWGVPIIAECGGACSCATCHVYVDEAWLDKLPPRSEEEEEKLDEAFDVRDNSRLSCQILMREDLDGMHVTIAPGPM
jgi:2Fe-2S ferredoxin